MWHTILVSLKISIIYVPLVVIPLVIGFSSPNGRIEQFSIWVLCTHIIVLCSLSCWFTYKARQNYDISEEPWYRRED